MKNTLTFLLLICFFTTLNAQKNYAPLGAEWKYEGHSFECTGMHKKYTVTDELLIDDKDCSLIQSYLWSDEQDAWMPQDTLIVWEDSAKVYFHENDAFYLLYDFDAQVGDTVLSYDPINRGLFSVTSATETQLIPNSTPYYVEAIEAIEVSGFMRKQFTTSFIFGQTDDICSDKTTIIENIGSTSMGLTGQWCLHVLSGCFGQIVCYANDEIEYESGFLSCDTFTGLTTLELTNELLIYPNPTTGKINLDLATATVNFVSFTLFDQVGKQLTQGKLQNQLDLSFLDAGIYYLRLSSQAGDYWVKRLVVVKN